MAYRRFGRHRKRAFTPRRPKPSAAVRKNTKLARANKRTLLSRRVLSDFIDVEELALAANSFVTYPIMDIQSWKAKLRTNPFIETVTHTYIPSIDINWACQLHTLNKSCTPSCFIVSMKKYAQTFIPTQASMVAGLHYQAMGQMGPLLLNPSYFKVHWHHSFNLASNTPGSEFESTSATSQPGCGNPHTCYRRGRKNLRMKLNIRIPTEFLDSHVPTVTSSWKNMEFEQLPYQQKLYLLVYNMLPPGSFTGNALFSYASHMVAINSD